MSETSKVFFKNRKLISEFALHLDECPVCKGTHFGKLFIHDGFKYYKCKLCSFVFTNPRLNNSGSSIWYNSDYYNAALETEIHRNLNQEIYYSASLCASHFEKITSAILNNFEDKNIRILDVGCATGSILSFLKSKHGYVNLKGIDLNKKAVDFAKNKRHLDVELKDINDLDEEEEYDLIINTENIEHVNSLDVYIKNLKKLLKHNGRILISTPNNDLNAVKWLRKFGDHFCAPNHINYFNSLTIERFLNNHGFKIEYLFVDKAPGPTLYNVVRSFLMERDQVVANPPKEATFSKPLWRFQKDRKKGIVLREPDIIKLQNEDSIDRLNNEKRKKSIKKLIKTLLNIRMFETYYTHLILIARKTGNNEAK